MPLNARESLTELLNSNKLDALLAAAKTKAATLNPTPKTAETELSELTERVNAVTKVSTKSAQDLRAMSKERTSQRAAKVAFVRHMLHVGNRIARTAQVA
jgi:hypothetical protein